jgi:DnaJ family protein C protein 2
LNCKCLHNYYVKCLSGVFFREAKAAKVVKEEPIVIPTNIDIDNLDDFSLYDILGLGNHTAPDIETIRKAYHKAVLLYHPDKKAMTGSEEDNRKVFLKVQEAFNTLCNEDKRRAYDSQLDFDESVPSEAEIAEAISKGPAAYCDLFRPVFDRNARFAQLKPVPSFGDANSTIDEVNAFYSYWVRFESWRDFTNSGEHRPDEATSREEKRWMQKENATTARKLKKKEMARINDLVMSAMAKDPRILADKEAQRAAKEQARMAREVEAKRLADEAAQAKQRELEEQEREKQLLKLAKEEKEKHKKVHSKYRSTFRKILRAYAQTVPTAGSQDEYGEFSNPDVDTMCSQLTMEEISELVVALGGEEILAEQGGGLIVTEQLSEAMQRVRLLSSNMKDREREQQIADAAAKEAQRREQAERLAEKNKALEREWTRDDLSMLSKCLVRFPAGIQNRWETISNYMNLQLKPVRPFDKNECMKSAQNAMNFLAAKIAPKPAETVKAPVKAEAPSTAAVTAAPAAALPKAALEPTSPAMNGPSAAAKASTAPAVAPSIPVPSASAPKATNAPASAAADTATSDASALPSRAASEAKSAAVWSQEQQRALEVGIRKYPAAEYADKVERWRLIAKEVPGKTASECLARFKHLREQVQSKTAK